MSSWWGPWAWPGRGGGGGFGRSATSCSVVDAIHAVPYLDLGRAADVDHRDAAGQFGDALLQLLTIVVRGGHLDLRLNLSDARFDVGLLAGAADDGRVIFLDRNLLGTAQHVELDAFQLDAEILGNRRAPGQDGDVLQYSLATVTEARRLHRCHHQATAQLVDDEGCKRLALDVISNDEQRLARLHHRFEQRQQFLQA